MLCQGALPLSCAIFADCHPSRQVQCTMRLTGRQLSRFITHTRLSAAGG